MNQTFQRITDKIEQLQNRFQDYLLSLQERERIALLVMLIFISVVGVAAALWYTHLAANTQQQRLLELKDTIVRMQSSAVKLSSDTIEVSTLSEKIQRVAQSQALTVQSQQQNKQIKLTTHHQNYAVLANFITQLAAQGIKIVMLDMQKQDDQTIVLNMTLE